MKVEKRMNGRNGVEGKKGNWGKGIGCRWRMASVRINVRRRRKGGRLEVGEWQIG
jgi:hypothetical protein